MTDLRVWCEFGSTRPDGVTVNRVPGEWAKVTPSHLLAAIREGVESGTIKGEVATRQVCEICGSMQDHVEGSFVHKARWRTEAFLVIPVSDGGEDR